MTPLDAIILGLVEGLTEYIPVSSTGHLILTAALLGLDRDPASEQAVDAFNVVVQGGAILAVLALYANRVLQMIRGLLGKNHVGRRLLLNIIIAFIPAAALGVLLADRIESLLFSPGPVVAALAVGGVWMILLDRRDRRRAALGYTESGLTIESMTWKHALAIGLFQTVAMWPGTSRSMMTIAGASTLGMRRKDAAEFSFLLGLPTLGGACVYTLAKNLEHASRTGQPNLFQTLGWTSVLLGIAVATVSAALAVRWLVAFLTRHGLAVFGLYRIALAILVAVLAWQGVLSL